MRLFSILITSQLMLGCQGNLLEQDKKKSSANAKCETDAPSLSIVNGRETKDHNSVALLIRQKVVANGYDVSICTGTFVGHNVLITAGHCVDDSVSGGVYALQVNSYDTAVIDTEQGFAQAAANGVKALRVLHHGYTENELVGPNGDALNEDKTNLDMAVLLFPDNTAQYASRIIKRSAAQGEVGKIVGFGHTSLVKGKRTRAIKREGDVRINGPQVGEGLIYLYANDVSSNAVDFYASSAAGDSGGPLFIDGILSGVSSSGGDFGNGYGHTSVYVDLTSSDSVSLMERAKKAGAIFHDGPSGIIRTNSQGSGC